MDITRQVVIDYWKNEFTKEWLPRGTGPLTQKSGDELMFSTDDAPWIRYQTACGLLPVRLRSVQVHPEPAMSWQIKDGETNRIVVCKLDGDDLRMVLKNPRLLGEAFDACLAIQSGITPRRM